MKKFKISIVLPTIAPLTLPLLYNQIANACGKHKFEVIAVGPYFPPKELENKSDFRYLQDFGSPSRSLMLGAYISQGEYLTWFPDDCIIEPLSLEKCVDFLDTKTNKDGLTILYSEGTNFTGTQHLDDSYWKARTHADLQLKMVQENWRIAPIFMYNLDYFREIGGLLTTFEHINMNTHVLSFMIQNNGGTIFPSPCKVFASNWQPWSNIESQKSPIQLAYEQNDKPLFDKMFKGDTEYKLEEKIDFENWRNADSVWKRRFKEEN